MIGLLQSFLVIVLAAQEGTAPDGTPRPPTAILRPPMKEADNPENPALATGTTALEMSLDECVHSVLVRNVSLKLSELANASNATGILQALGSFDPELYATATSAQAETPTTSVFQTERNDSLNGSTGLRGLYPSGLAYNLSYSLDYNRRSSNSFFLQNPTILSNLNLSVTQPLLRGFGTTVNEAGVEQARLLVARGDLDLYAQVQETAFRAVEAYWNLVRARRQRDTARSALAVAEELVSNNQKRLDAGVMTRLDVLTAQTEAARRKETLIRAENGVGRAEDALKSLLSPGTNLADWRVAITPTTNAMLRDEALPSEEEAAIAAFVDRSDLRAVEVDVRAAGLNVEVAENQSLPKLNLTGSYGYAGVAGSQAGVDNKTNAGLWVDSLTPIRDRDFRTWSVGFDFAHPIGNRTAESNERKARIDKERAYMTWLDKRMSVVQELRAALRDVSDAKAATEAATQARILAEQQYQAELVRLENQHSTTFQVREVQRDLFEAQDGETAAITQYEILLSGLERARGRLAQRFGVTWEPVGRSEGALME